MKILITGSSGVAALSIINQFLLTDHELILTDRISLNQDEIIGDLSNFNFVQNLIKENQPDFIVHLAANTNVDLCEQNKMSALLDNFVATKNIIDVATPNQIPIIFTSSASVFRGNKKSGYSEDDLPEPSNFYALTKLLAENYIKSNMKKYVILRLGWLVGDYKRSNKFVGQILSKIKNGDKEFYGVNNIWGSLTFANDLAKIIQLLIEKEKFGVFNLASIGSVSRYEMLVKIIELLELQNSISLVGVKNDFFKLSAKRPKYEILKLDKIIDSNL
ncbi:MAG: NAD(P)-dependent oxidoreductase, partial [Ignavibacteriae bacterium]|nr:NAD(P)-dependent oxidoreductase [Ignavibacteriota bacterium]